MIGSNVAWQQHCNMIGSNVAWQQHCKAVTWHGSSVAAALQGPGSSELPKSSEELRSLDRKFYYDEGLSDGPMVRYSYE